MREEKPHPIVLLVASADGSEKPARTAGATITREHYTTNNIHTLSREMATLLDKITAKYFEAH